MAKKKETVGVEEAFAELEEIIKQLESDEIPLKESIALYARGAELVAACREELSGIEKEMIIIGEQFENTTEEE